MKYGAPEKFFCFFFSGPMKHSAGKFEKAGIPAIAGKLASLYYAIPSHILLNQFHRAAKEQKVARYTLKCKPKYHEMINSAYRYFQIDILE